jgi:TonB family protein
MIALALAPRAAAAQTPETTPPVAVDAGHVVYPAGAHGSAAVVLDLVIEKDGRVGDVAVVDGEEPFVSAGLAAARQWTFTPARRGDLRVSARVRMRVDFRPPVTAPAPRPSTPPVSSSAAPPATAPPGDATPPPSEVLVLGVRKEVGETQLGGAEVRQMPGAFGDAFRAIEALPGVTPIVSGLPFFFVRGAPPGNVGYFLDGIPVPLLYHLALGPSVVHPGLIDQVDFFPGGYPARYGRFAGGILDGETLPPASRMHWEGNVRLFDAGALAEAPLLDDRMTVLVAGRYSYTAALVQLFAPNTRVGYWDYQTRVMYRLTPKDRISLFWFGSFDEIDNRDQQTTYDQAGDVIGQSVGPFYPVFKTEFHRADLRYDHDTPRGHLRVAATFGIEDSIAGSSATQQTGVSASSVRLRAEGDERLSPDMKLRYGADVLLNHYSLDLTGGSGSDLQSLYPSRNDVMIGAFGDVIWKASPRVEVVPGLRTDVFTSRLAPGTVSAGQNTSGTASGTATVAPEPRLATRFRATPKVTWVSTFGVAHQPPSLLVPIPGLTLGSLATGLQTSLQASQGAEVELPLDFKLTSTVFLHDYLGLNDATATCLGNGTSVPSASNNCLAQQVRGRAFGIELLARRDLTKRITGWVSYTLSRSTRETHGVVFDGSSPNGSASVTSTNTLQEIPAEFDRTHVLNILGAVDLGRGWRAGARFFIYSGRPYSPTVQGVPVPPFNSERLPTFYRFDVRLEKRWRAFGNGYVAFVVEGMNVTLSKEAISAQCNNDGTVYPLKYDTCSPQYIGPVTVPSIGVEAGM